MSTLTSTILPASFLIPGRTKPTNFPNHKVLFHQNDHYLNSIVPQKKRASSLGIQAQVQLKEEAPPASTDVVPINRPKFVLFGSSIVQYGFYEGWAATLAHVYGRQVDVILRGYEGWTSRDALRILDQVFPKNALEQPSLVIVYFGGNDATNGQVPLEEFKENMRKIFTHLKELSEKTRILFLSTPPINETQSTNSGFPAKTNESNRIYSEASLEVSREFNINAIDLWSAIQKRPNWKEVSFIDGVHLSNEGSKVVSREIFKALKEANWVPKLYWKSMPIEFIEYSHPPPGLDPYSTRFPLSEEWEYPK